MPQNASSTEGGAYTLNGDTSNAALNAITRNADAKIFIPSESEWYKAAYYDPTLSSGTGGYLSVPVHATPSPTSAMPGSTPDTGNFRTRRRFAVTGSTSYSSSQTYLTAVGAYTALGQPLRPFDMGGNVFQWNEALSAARFGACGVVRGSTTRATCRPRTGASYDPTSEDLGVGFRVASVPEPSTAVLAVIASGLMWVLRKRFK